MSKKRPPKKPIVETRTRIRLDYTLRFEGDVAGGLPGALPNIADLVQFGLAGTVLKDPSIAEGLVVDLLPGTTVQITPKYVRAK